MNMLLEKTREKKKTSEKRCIHISGKVSRLKFGRLADRSEYCHFRLLVPGFRPTPCAAFAQICDAFSLAFAEGDQVKLYGYFEDVQYYSPKKGENVKLRRFHVLASYPKEDAKNETP